MIYYGFCYSLHPEKLFIFDSERAKVYFEAGLQDAIKVYLIRLDIKNCKEWSGFNYINI